MQTCNVPGQELEGQQLKLPDRSAGLIPKEKLHKENQSLPVPISVKSVVRWV